MEQPIRVRVARILLATGIPFYRLENRDFRWLLEENRYPLTSHGHMGEYIPFIAADVKKDLKQTLDQKQLTVFFDGTGDVADAQALVVRYIDKSATASKNCSDCATFVGLELDPHGRGLH